MQRHWYRSAICYVFPVLLLTAIGCGGEKKENSDTNKKSKTESNAKVDPAVPAGTKAHSVSTSPGPNPALKRTDENQKAESKEALKLLKKSAKNPIVGTWAGVAILNQDILKQKIARTTDPAAAELIQKRANAFLSTEVAVDFYNDGRFSQVVAIKGTDGKQQLHEIVGKWKVVQQNGDSFQIDLEESFSGNKETVKSLVRFKMHTSGNRMARPASVHKDLERCEPMLVFARQLPPEEDPSRIAEEVRPVNRK